MLHEATVMIVSRCRDDEMRAARSRAHAHIHTHTEFVRNAPPLMHGFSRVIVPSSLRFLFGILIFFIVIIAIITRFFFPRILISRHRVSDPEFFVLSGRRNAGVLLLPFAVVV